GGALGNMDRFRERLLAVSSETGVAKEALVEGASSFLALTGDADTTRKSLELFAKVAKASGASMGDISASAAAMNQNLGITGDQFERAFSILIAGGKAGAIELKDVA